MKLTFHSVLLLALCCAFVLAACGRFHPPKSASPQPSTPAVESAEQENRHWQQQFDAEVHLRLQVESRLNGQQEAASSRWQNTATLLAVLAVVPLLFGAILGSSARHESENSA